MRIRILFLVLLLILPFSFGLVIDPLEQSVPVSYCNGIYELEATYIHEGDVEIRLNNETSKILKYHELYGFNEGSRVYVREIIEEEAKEGPDMVWIRFYPEICDVIVVDDFLEKDSQKENITVVSDNETINITYNETLEQEKTNDKNEYVKEQSENIEKQVSLFDIIINWFKGIFER